MILLAALLAAAPVNCTAATTQVDMNQCAGARYKRADAALNVAWRKLMAQAGPAKADYLAAQRLWLQFRDAECKAEGKSFEGGSIQPMIVSGCQADLTEARAKQIGLLAQDH
jgi:uncharacterized protein YecT (DUF1311 family)